MPSSLMKGELEFLALSIESGQKTLENPGVRGRGFCLLFHQSEEVVARDLRQFNDCMTIFYSGFHRRFIRQPAYAPVLAADAKDGAGFQRGVLFNDVELASGLGVGDLDVKEQ